MRDCTACRGLGQGSGAEGPPVSRRRAFQGAGSSVPARGLVSALVRAIALAGVVSVAAAWAVVRHYAERHAPMLVPTPKSAPTYDMDAGEVPVPEWLEPDAG